MIHPTTDYLDNRCYRELRSYLRHTEWQVGISLTFFFHFIYFLDFIFMSDLLHYKWEICILNMTVEVLTFSKFSINEDKIWHFQQRILQNINVFSKISKESTSFCHIHFKSLLNSEHRELYSNMGMQHTVGSA